MSWLPPATILEKRIVDAIAAESWATGSEGSQTATVPLAVRGAVGYGIKLPLVRVVISGGEEEPEYSSNYAMTVEITVASSTDITTAAGDADEAYETAFDNHNKIVGNLFEWLATDSNAVAASLSGGATGYANEVEVKAIRISGFDRGEMDDERIEDVVRVEVYTYMTT